MSQPAAPDGVVARAHPFTPLIAALAVIALVFLLPAPAGPVGLMATLVLLTPVLRDARALIPAAWLALPFWGFLFFLHAVIGDPPMIMVGPFALSEQGLATAITTSARLTAVILASVLLVRGFRPGRFVDAALAAGWPWTAAYLGAATLNAIPRFQERAVRVREAMRARGLRVSGNIVVRTLAFVPLALPLMLGALHDVDERAFALATRQVRLGEVQRTPLRTPEESAGDRAVRRAAVALVLIVLVWRLVR